MKAPARVFQLCLAHQLRDLQRVLDANPWEKWASAMQKLFRSAIHLRNRFNDKRSAIYPEIPPTNNESEQALRGGVVHCKVTNCFRSK